MLMAKANRRAIYEYLFKEGVMIAKKEFVFKKHPQVGVPNIHVIKTMQSLVSRGLVKELFAWRHYYWFIENAGIEYLREVLHLPPEIVPETCKRSAAGPRSDGKMPFKSGLSRPFDKDEQPRDFKEDGAGTQELQFSAGSWNRDRTENRQLPSQL